MLEHGGRLRAAARQYGIAREQWLDLSTGIAPWSFALPVIEASAWARLPETDDGLEAAACAYYDAPQVLPVPGSQVAIQLLPRLRRVGKVGVLSPCYAEHAAAWRRTGHRVREISEVEVETYLDSLDVLVLVNPNNPTGRLVPPERLLAWHARLAERGGWLVVDEAFMDHSPADSVSRFTARAGLIVLRSFGKFFGLAGARLGFALAEPVLLRQLAEQVGPWAVGGPIRAVGLACLQDHGAQSLQRGRCALAAERLQALLSAHGLAPQGGCALFQWLSTEEATRLQGFLAERGILVRLFAHDSSLRFGLPGEAADWQRLDAALHAYRQTPHLAQDAP